MRINGDIVIEQVDGDVEQKIVIDGDPVDTIIEADVGIPVRIDGDIGASNIIDGELEIIRTRSSEQQYEGDTEVTPSLVEQILLTNGKIVNANIKVKPIPSNYGLITWDGRKLTVS